MNNHIMVDLETLDTAHSAKILSIGAVEFGPEGLGREFYVVLNLEEQLHSTESESTKQWWARQSPEACRVLTDPKVPLAEGLGAFNFWLRLFGSQKTRRIWGNGANFDNPILAHAYAKHHPAPYAHFFYNDRCYRTLKAMFAGIEMDKREGTYHNALDDAKTQALHAIKILNEVQLWATV